MASEGRNPASLHVESGTQGFTLVEVLVAAVILLVGFQAGMLGISLAVETRSSAVHRQEATMIGERIAQNLVVQTTNDGCSGGGSGADLLQDLQSDSGTSSDLLCFGSVSDAPYDCTPDYPRSGAAAADLSAAIGPAAGASDSPVYVADAANHLVRYNGHSFRVVWNVICDMPMPNSQRGTVLVGWAPFSEAISRGRFVSIELEKANGF